MQRRCKMYEIGVTWVFKLMVLELNGGKRLEISQELICSRGVGYARYRPMAEYRPRYVVLLKELSTGTE
ncbi:hypothetical protein L1987_15736 [Smallanthus sonchifolius]|uniref:Uncharacterized protein n=1 Tax=Smallanthus sonchifolius TaxID=185202 RepID=A0ACB9J7E4_9ASTR|nr:hypothetical protein L1987_15736 [Smallanthus sonchifolius]